MEFKKIIESFKNRLAEQKAPEFEIFLSREHEVEAEVKDQNLHAFNASESVGVALRVLIDQKLGFAYTTDFSETSIQKTVEAALHTSRYSHRREFLSLAKSSPSQEGAKVYDLKDCDPDFLQTSPQSRIQKALEMEKAALSLDPRVKRVRGASVSANFSEVYLINSWGLEKHHQKTMNVLSLMAVAEADEDSEGVFEFDFSSFLSILSPEAVGKQAAKKALQYLGAKPGPTLKCPVILDALVAADVLEVLAPSFYAESLLKKRSLFEGKQGQSVLSPLISLVDDGRLKEGYASFPFDAEGVTTQKTVVVEKGVFKNYLADLEYGQRMKAASTGSSEREGIKSPPQISYSNFYLESGNFSFEDLLKQVPRAVYITELIGMHTANPISGDFSVGAQGFWVEQGEIRYPLKQMAFSGNLREMLSRVKAVGKDVRSYFKLISPPLLIEEMDIGGT